MHFRPLPLLTIASVISLALLYVLGSWQWSRYQQKLGEEVAPAYPFVEQTITPITAPGKMSQQLNGQIGGKIVWRRYVPAQINGEGEIGLLMYDVFTGISPEALSLSDALPPITTEFAVFAPTLRTNYFAPDNKPDEDRWARRDAPAMLENLGFEPGESVQVFEPRTVTVIDEQIGPRVLDNPYAASRPADGLPPARHLGYALTWWGLGLALFGVYIAFHVARGRLRFGRS